MGISSFNVNSYTRNQPELRIPQPPIVAKRSPNNNDKYTISQEWINTLTNAVFVLTSYVNGIPTWSDITGASGLFTAITVTTGPNSILGTTSINNSGIASTNIGTGTNSGVTTIGNTATAGSGIALNVGSGNLVVTGGGNVVSIGADAAANTVLVGSLTNGATTSIDGGNSTGVGSAAITLGTAAAGDIQVGLTSHTGTIFVGTSTVGDTVRIGASAGPNTVIVGTTNTTAATTINAGSGGIGLTGAVTSANSITVTNGTITSNNTGSGVAFAGVTSAGTGVTATLASLNATTDTLRLTGGGIRTAPVSSASGASPRTVSARFGVADFTTVINAAATAALAITNTMSTTGSIVLATVQCATVGSAVVIRNIDVSVAGTITVNVTNLGGTNTGADIFVTFWLMN